MAEFASELAALTQSQIEDLLSQSEFEEVADVGQPISHNSTSKASRFAPVNQNEILSFLKEQENENTRKKTETDVRLFKTFCISQNEHRNLEDMLPNELDILFGNFLVSVRKQNGNEYEPSTIRGFMSSLDRYLKSKNYSFQVNKGPMFPHSNNCIKAKMTHLKSEGYGNRPNESDELTDEDIDKLFEAGLLGHESPQQVVNLLHITFSLLFGMRGGKEQRDLKWGDIELLTDEDGDEYLSHIRERHTKTRPGADPKNVRKFKPKAWALKDDVKRCPIAAYKVYREQRPTQMNDPDTSFFLSINYGQTKPNQLWFKNQPMGKNHIYGLVKTMREKCGSINDGRKITNHSVRKHLMQKCNDLGLPADDAMQISGHKNIQSANAYKKLNENQQKKISHALMDTNTEKLPIVPAYLSPRPGPSSSWNSPPLIQSSQNVLQQKQASSIFSGSTTITGGTFYFGLNRNETENPFASAQEPQRKYRRIMPILDSDSE